MCHELASLKLGQCHKMLKPRNPCASHEDEAKSALGASRRHEHIQPLTQNSPPPTAGWSDMASLQSPPPAEKFQGSDWTPQNSSGPQWRLLHWQQWHRCRWITIPYDSVVYFLLGIIWEIPRNWNCITFVTEKFAINVDAGIKSSNSPQLQQHLDMSYIYKYI